MKRIINGFRQDKVGDWIAELSCGHTRHLRHQPPFQDVGWVLDPQRRLSKIGEEMTCLACSRGDSDLAEERDLRIAAAVKGACLQAAIEAYQHGKMSGMCQEGAVDLALDAIRSLNAKTVLDGLPD